MVDSAGKPVLKQTCGCRDNTDKDSYMLFSVIVPVYNRPDEVNELLKSLCTQSYANLEILIVEDGSENDCRRIAESYRDILDIHYFYKANSGQGFSRNYGFERASGDYLVVFDSDCIIPQHYFQTIYRFLKSHSGIDAWGGPDRAHPYFTPVQKAISYAMTSPFTTGGMRGKKNRIGSFHPRSFNMGISRKVYEETGGYRITRMGEDLEFSIRIIKTGFRSTLIEEAYVYHKRRTNFRQFFKQLYFFGRARINIQRFHPDEVKLLHLLPSLFVLGLAVLILLLAINFSLYFPFLLPLLLFALIILGHSYLQEKNGTVSLLSLAASFILLIAYGAGFLRELYHYSGGPEH